ESCAISPYSLLRGWDHHPSRFISDYEVTGIGRKEEETTGPNGEKNEFQSRK
ncbi:hypothetical protein KI387_042071, partial [Taxus chinensis]